MATQPTEQVKPNPLNYAICLSDAFSFNYGMAFWSLTTIVPLFLHQLHAPNSLIGALPALVSLGYSAPGLFVSRRVSRLRVAKWWLLWVAIGERVPLLAIALALPWLASHVRDSIVPLFMIGFGVHAVVLGFNQPAYWSFISKTIPARVRGRVYGWAGVITGISGLSIDPITRHFLTPAGIETLHGFASCFLLGVIVLIVGILPFALIDEPVHIHNDASDPHEGHFLTDSIKIWRAEPKFRTLVYSEIALTIITLAQSFYILECSRRFAVSGDTVAGFTTISVVGGALSLLVWGYIGDHWGNKIVLVIAAVLGFCGPVMVCVHPPLSTYNAIFLLNALSSSAFMLGGFNIIVESASNSKEVPFYTTLFNSILTPARVLAPLVGGLIADKLGYEAVFVIAAIAGAVSIGAVMLVTDPRRKNAEPIQT